MAYNIFISCEHKDTDLARDLSKRLEKAGVSVTNSASKIDNPRDDKDRIKNLQKADEVIFLMTNNAIEGYKVLFDLGVANTLEKRLACILVGLKPKELPEIVKGLDFIKYDELDRYISRLRRRVEDAAKSQAKAQPKSGQTSKSAA
jgi:TIR domain